MLIAYATLHRRAGCHLNHLAIPAFRWCRAALQSLQGYVQQRMDSMRTFVADASAAQRGFWSGVEDASKALTANAKADAESAREQVRLCLRSWRRLER